MTSAFLLAAALAGVGADPASAGGAAFEPAAAWQALDGMRAAYAKVSDYECRFAREELLPGGPAPREEIQLRFRKPFAVAMTWVGSVHRGRRGLYVAGWNDNRIHAREGGLLGLFALNLDPAGKRAMAGNRHPITEVGIGHAIEVIAGDLDRARIRDEVAVQALGEERVGGRPALAVDLRFARQGYYASRQRVWIDRGLGLPTRVEVFDGEGRRLERYEYTEIRLNPGLGDADFRP